MQTVDKNNRSALERFLNLFAEVHSGEAGNTLLLTLSIFLILTSYYIAKVVREPLILAGGGAELKSYLAAFQAILLILFVGAYARLVERLNRRRLLTYVTGFFVLGFAAFYLLGVAKVAYVGVIYFIWVGIFSLTIIAQFWGFANDIHTPEAGKRLFAIIAFGGSLGAVVGAKLAEVFIDIIGIYELLLISAALLLTSLVLVNVVESRRREATSHHAPLPGRPPAEEPAGQGGAFGVVRRNHYLLLIALLVLVTNWVNTTGEFILGDIVSKAAHQAAAGGGGGEAVLNAEKVFIGKFYADFFFWVNLIGLATQLFLVSRLIKWFGIRTAILVMPLIALGGYCLVAITPILSLVRLAKTGENATDYSLNNTARQMLFLPTTREEKYKAKVAIDSFFVRIGDVLSAGVVYAGGTWLAFKTQQFAIVNVALVVLWLILAVAIGKENRRLMAAADSANARA